VGNTPSDGGVIQPVSEKMTLEIVIGKQNESSMVMFHVSRQKILLKETCEDNVEFFFAL